MNRKTGFAVGTLFLVLILATSAASAATIDFDEKGPAPYMAGDLSKEKHVLSWDLTEYEDNYGDLQDLPATVNESGDNPYSFYATGIDADAFRDFPRDGDGTSWLNSSQWAKVGDNSSKMTISETQTSQGVEALRISTSGMASGDLASAKFSDIGGVLDSDESKRVLQIAGDVDQLNGTVNLMIFDEDGDSKMVQAGTWANASEEGNWTSSTGSGKVTQVKLSDLSTDDSDGDGWDNIAWIELQTVDDDVDLSLSWMDLEQKGRTKLGSQLDDTDSDDELETVDIYEPQSLISVSDLSTLELSDSAAIHDLEYPVKYRAQDLTSGDVEVSWSTAKAVDPSFDWILNSTYYLEVPSAIDLSHSGLEIRQEQQWTSSRYLDARVAYGVGDDPDFGAISWDLQKTDSLTDQGSTVDLYKSPSPNRVYAVNHRVLTTQGERDALETGGQAAGQFQESNGGGGIFGGFLSTLTGKITAILSALGLGGLWASRGS